MNADPPPDVTLLLRAHSEQHWLSREVIPVIRQIETGRRLPEEQLPAAVAYLGVIWAKAARLAREADAALRALDALDATEEGPGSPSWSLLRHPSDPPPLPTKARRYHASVRELRAAVAWRVEALMAAPVTRPTLPIGEQMHSPNRPAAPAAGKRVTRAPAPRRH